MALVPILSSDSESEILISLVLSCFELERPFGPGRCELSSSVGCGLFKVAPRIKMLFIDGSPELLNGTDLPPQFNNNGVSTANVSNYQRFLFILFVCTITFLACK